ncbi:MAG: helix-turn-helix transcriptional regulator [Calditrichaeota bacterium]|nr:helix-turn-helix transcriptional regulator [Calditrichota bacterium]
MDKRKGLRQALLCLHPNLDAVTDKVKGFIDFDAMNSAKRLPLHEMLKAARKKLGLSGRAIGRISGKPSGYIQKLENGSISPTMATLEEICPFYGIEPWEAVAGMPKQDLARLILGPVPAGDPLLTEVRALLEGPEGRKALEFLVSFEKENPGRVAELLRVAAAVRNLDK